MTTFYALEPSIDPNNRITFLLDWELTMKCNLDCSYCKIGTYGGHDNSTQHPPLVECLKTVEFMYQYVDLYMKRKPNGIKYVVLNVYGGESLHHPSIDKILQYCLENYQQHYCEKWNLSITTTTNAIVSSKKIQSVLPFIDEFTCSYHPESTDRQKQQFKDNLLAIQAAGKKSKCVILMHPDRFEDSQALIDWCSSNNITYLPRQIDHATDITEFNYNEQQVQWFESLYQTKSFKADSTVVLKQVEDKVDLADSGRACCGGRQLCQDGNQRARNFFVNNQFPDWFCSVNQFFVYIKQLTGEVFVNKDCKMKFDGTVGPIGTLQEGQSLLDWTQESLDNDTMPIIQCKKRRCFCGLCAPKAETLETFKSIMRKYQK